ncbi:hypothetical protein ACQP1G_21330 [Nocardia sp. CA-107356]|uniref:hypothetical protein n=1 Tax=Nocardia sp. CA-107356 TaxID=3239972 RepID=UPI003D8B0FF1
MCRIAAPDHAGLQEVLLSIDRSPHVVRSTSVIVLSTLVGHRTSPVLRSGVKGPPTRLPAYRAGL